MPYITDTTQAATCDALLIKSNRIYQEIEKIYQGMMDNLSDSTPEKIMLSTETLSTLFKNAFTLDSMISERLTQKPNFTDLTEQLLSQRNILLAGLHRTNNHLTRKAENVKALLRHELSTMNTNRTALNGYKKTEPGRKSFIRHAF